MSKIHLNLASGQALIKKAALSIKKISGGFRLWKYFMAPLSSFWPLCVPFVFWRLWCVYGALSILFISKKKNPPPSLRATSSKGGHRVCLRLIIKKAIHEAEVQMSKIHLNLASGLDPIKKAAPEARQGTC